MKKTKKALATLAIAGMALTMVPFNAFAANTVPLRLAGTTAAQTAVAIAEQTGYMGKAILASSASYGASDALTAGPLAAYLKAPILLQEPGAVLNADTKAELTKLNVKTVYVTSGTAVISQAVLDQLAGMGITVESLGGADRFETSVNIAKKLVALGAPVKKVAVAYGWLNQDALSIASIASYANEPIILTEKAGLSASAKAFLAANLGITASDVIGGTGVIDASVLAQLPSPTRHSGNTAYDTNNQVIQDFASSLAFDNVFVANGVTGIDALAGAPLAAMTKSAIVLTDGVNVPAAATFVHSKMTATGVVTALGGAAVVPDAVRVGVATGVVTPAQGALSVTSVSAVSANSLKVVFNQAPADVSKVKVAVTRSTTPVTVTTTWNAAKTEVTLTGAANLPEGSYAVAVKNDATDLGTSTVAITQQKIAKITITSTKLAVNNNTGYASYQVFDQYQNDITSSYLANNITFQSGVSGGAGGNITKKNGLITLTPNTGTTLITYATVVISGSDTTSGISTSASLTTSTALGTLSNLTLNKLTNAEDKVLTAGDTASIWYIDYTATDISGNATKDLSLVQNGLIMGNLITSNNDVTAVVDQDPSDTNKAVIKVTVSGNTISADMPVTITAMTYLGTNSTLNLTLKKASKLDSFTLMSPSYDIASGESKEIPFVAYDQNGTQLTKFDDLKAIISGLSLTGCSLHQNVDGTASIFNDAVVNGGTQSVPKTLTAVTSTGKLSTITLNIQKPAVPDTFTLDSSVLVSAMQAGAVQGIDFGYNHGGLTVKDQYGRVMDMTDPANSTVYEILATTTGSAITLVGADGDENETAATIAAGPVAYSGYGINIHANAAGSGTVNFKLIKKVDQAAVQAGNTSLAIASQNATISVIANPDIKGYTMDTVAKPILATATDTTTGGAIGNSLNTLYDRNDGYAANPYIYGLTASGAKVVLGGTPVIGVSSTSSDFVVDGFTGAAMAYDAVKLVALKFADAAKTGSSTTLTVTLMGADGNVHTVTTPITSTTSGATASDIAAYVDTTIPGVSVSDAGDVVTVDITNNATVLADAGLVTGNYLARFNAAGVKAGRAGIYFYAKDQYGTKAMKLANVLVVPSGTTLNGHTFSVLSDGTMTAAGIAAGDTVTLSGVTSNGLVKTIQIVFE